MKKYIQYFILSLLLFTMGWETNAQNWVNLGSSMPKEISATVTESNNQSIRVLFDTKGFNSESINEDNAIYQRLSIPGAGKTQTVGSPELPLFRQMVAIPECSNVSLSFQVLQEQVLNNYNIYPAPDYQVVTNPDSTCYVEEVFSKNVLCYVDNLLSPSNNAELTETGYFRSQKYVEIQVSPIRYNPTTQKLYVATEIEVILTLTNATGATSSNLGIFNNVAAHTMLNYESTGMTAEENDMRFGRGSVNYIELQTANQANSIQADYLIICADQFIENGAPSEELMRIARHRAYYNGFDVAILNVDNIIQVGFPYNNSTYMLEEMMRSFIEKVYEGSHALHTFDGHLGYVLFVGKPSLWDEAHPQNVVYQGFVPTSYGHEVKQQFENEPALTYPSDYWFSCVTHDNQNVYDEIGDLFIGRFCVATNTQLYNIIEKTIKREREYRPVQSRIVNAANDTIYRFMEHYFDEEYYPYISGYLGQEKTLTTADRWHDDIGTYRSKVLNMLNEGSPLFIINTHGGYNCWETLMDGFSYNILNYLDNGSTMNQFCLSYACLTGAMDVGLPCLGQTITSFYPSKGMVGFLGSGRLLGVSPRSPQTFVIGLLPKAIYHDLSHISGEFVLEALLNDSDRQMRYKLNLFGDPALNIMAKGFEVTNEITLDDFTEINDVITIKNGGRIIIPDNARVVVGDNAGFKVMSTGSLSIGKNVSIKSINGNNSFIQIAGGEFITSTQGNISFEKMNVKFSNPSFVENKTYNLDSLNFSMTEVYTTAVNMYVKKCNFNNSSNVCADHTCFTIDSSYFHSSGLVIGNTSIIGIPIGGVLPTTSAFVSNCGFIDCIPFEYPTYGLSRATSNSAIQLQNVSNYELQNNTFLRCVEGIYIKNSGSNQYCQLYKNTITSCTSHGLIVYNSYANLHKNTICENGGRGISIYNNSLVALNDSPGNPNDYQLISLNNPYQIYASNNAFPRCNYNKFIGNNNGDYWMYYEANGAAASTTSTSQFNVKYNNWDGNIGFNPNVVFNVPNRFEWLPFWNIAKSGEGLTESEMLYEQAVQDFEDSLYVKAKSGFLHVISDYPEDWVAISALKELLRVENCLDKDYSNLKSYYLTNETIQQHGALKQLADFLSARCDVNMKKYEDALEWYATQLSDENLTYQDSIFYIIDVGDIYYLMEEDSVCKGNLPVWFEEHKEVLPKSIIEHEKNTKQLLSTLPFENGIESKQPLYGEFYSFAGWEDNNGGSGIRSLAHYTEHGKKVELPYSYLIDDPEAMGIGDLITDATPGVLYNKDCGAGQTNKLYRSMDYGHTWEAIDDLSGCSDEYWTFKNAPGILLKLSHILPGELKISYDYGSHFEVMDIPAFEGSNEAGWNVGEFFKGSYSYELSSYCLTHSMDFNQTVDTVYYSEQDFLNMRAGAKEGELYTYYPSYDDPNYYFMSYKLFFSSDYGQHQQMVMTADSLIIGDVYVMDSWEFMVDSEPGVFYSIKRENSIVYANSGKIWIDYYRDYGETLVTTYFHHFRPDWYSQHSPVMDCEVTGCNQNSIALRWNEPELKPDEVLVGYQVYRGDDLISDLITETEYTDLYSGNGRLKYHVLAIYSDGETSKAYNIVYCEQTDGVDENDGETTVTVYPNPAKDKITIDDIHPTEVQVYNVLGQLVKTVHGTNEIGVKDLVEGVYLLRITDNKGTAYTERIMITR